MQQFRNNYLVVDTETGGLKASSGVSLLSISAEIFDREFKTITEFDMLIRPKGGKYLISPEAMAVNKIDLIQHDREAVDLMEVAYRFEEWLRYHTRCGEQKVVPVGHYVQHDIDFIQRDLVDPADWEHFCTRSKIDTKDLAEFCKLQGYYTWDCKTGLGELCLAENIELTPHVAKNDRIATKSLLRRFISVL